MRALLPDIALPGASFKPRSAPRLILCACALLVAVMFGMLEPNCALAAGLNAVMTPSGYGAVSVAREDDTSNLIVSLPFTMNWNRTSYTQIYINMNGNCTFGASYRGFNPSISLASANRNIMAPFWADVDTRNTAASQVTYSTTTGSGIPLVDGHKAFFVNWLNVASYFYQSTPTNSFQLVLVDRSDTGTGNFDFIFNYDAINWDIATYSSYTKACAGWGRTDGTGYELSGSGASRWGTSALLDTSSSDTSLIQNTMNADGQLGRYVFQVRNGGAPNVPPKVVVTNRTFEGNALDCYTGYTGAGDVTATDPDGSVASLTSDMPPVLPPKSPGPRPMTREAPRRPCRRSSYRTRHRRPTRRL